MNSLERLLELMGRLGEGHYLKIGLEECTDGEETESLLVVSLWEYVSEDEDVEARVVSAVNGYTSSDVARLAVGMIESKIKKKKA